MTPAKNKKATPSSTRDFERRKAKRIPILSSFALSLVIPKKGMYRHDIYDVSEIGIGFILNIDEEFSSEIPTQKGDQVEVHFYLNSSLFIPLTIRVVRIEDAQTGERRIGAEYEDKKSEPYHAFLAFLTFLDTIQPSVSLTPDPQYQ